MIYRQEMALVALFTRDLHFSLLGLRNSFILFIVSSKQQHGARGRSTSQEKTGMWLLKFIHVCENVLFLLIKWSPRGYSLKHRGRSCLFQDSSVLEEKRAALK